MPRYNVQGWWLRERISEMQRVSRKYMTTTELDTYWARVTAAVGTQVDNAREVREGIHRLQERLSALEVELDAKS